MPLGNTNDINQRFIPSKQLLPGAWANAITDALTSYQELVATPAGTQATSILANAANINITAVATAADGIKLPPAKVGMEITVINSDAADAAQIFSSSGDAFRTNVTAVAGATGVSLAAQATAIFRCVKQGIWSRFVSA